MKGSTGISEPVRGATRVSGRRNGSVRIEELLRDLTPQVLTALVRRHGGFDTCEDAVQEALLAAATQWPTEGLPDNRAKQRIKASGTQFRMPPRAELRERTDAVLHVLYLVFNEGYTASSGAALHRVELSAEAIRLTRQLHDLLPADGEVAGLLALMLLTDARRPARTGPDGALVPLAEQDRRRWDAAAIAEGVKLITGTLASSPVGPYQLQAAIAAVHDEVARAEDTDWHQILGLYELLHTLTPRPMVALNRIVAVAMVHGPEAGLRHLADAGSDPALAGHHRLHAVRAHLLELAGDRPTARDEYQLAARHTLSAPEQRYLESRAARLNADAAAEL